jgi:type VI secretion system secreted protein VgrG
MIGPQTAIVVGREGQEIWTDEFGRVKVQFHWDRPGKANENSSCWVRVSQPWAGTGWGSIAIPRVGQEVIVEFFEGDPDQPIITGRVYNASHMPPYDLPAGGHMMGFRSKSTKGGSGYNEIVIHDAKSNEKLIIHAQKDMTTTVEHDQTNLVVHGNQFNGVNEGDQQTVVQKDIAIKSATGQIYIEASTQICMKVGDSLLFMDKDGNIVLQGNNLYISGSSLTEIKGQPVQINCD